MIILSLLILDSGHSPPAVQIRHFLFTNHMGVTRRAHWSLRPALWLNGCVLVNRFKIKVSQLTFRHIYLSDSSDIGKHLCTNEYPICVSLITFSYILKIRFVGISLSCLKRTHKIIFSAHLVFICNFIQQRISPLQEKVYIWLGIERMKTQMFRLGSESSFIKCHYQIISILIKKQSISFDFFL